MEVAVETIPAWAAGIVIVALVGYDLSETDSQIKGKIMFYDNVEFQSKFQRLVADGHADKDFFAPIVVPSASLPKGYYATYVAENGHVPGVLSGSELRGNARKWGSWYRSIRRRVAAVLADHGVSDSLVYDPQRARWVRIWNVDGVPVPVITTATDNIWK